MTRIFVICLVLFPVIFVGMLFATGTLAELVPEVQSRIDIALAEHLGKRVGEKPATDWVDSLLVNDLESREMRVADSLDSLSAVQTRIETERREIERIGSDVQALISELRALKADIDEQRQKERRSLAKIFGEMEPARAAEILTLLDDDAVEFIVKSMKQRQAAEVLAMLSPSRAARLSADILAERDKGDRRP